MAAAGKVCTGFSYPYVASYAHSGTTVTLSSAMQLARGVSVTVEPDTAESNDFYADNTIAESTAGTFSGGTLTLTVDGLLQAAENFILGLTASTGWLDYGDSMSVPYVAVGYIARYMSDGETSYVPTVLYKCKFNTPTSDHSTQEAEIDWQTQELTAQIYRSDDANHSWKSVGTSYATEAAALTALRTKMGAS